MLQSFVYSVLLGSRVLFSLTSLRSFCLRLPRAALTKTVNGLGSRNATRFLLAAYHSPQAVSGCAGSVGCDQREPDNRRSSRVPSNSFEWPRRKEEGKTKLFEIVSPEFGRCPFLQDFRSERQSVVLRFAEPPALSPWRSAPRGGGRQAEPLVLSDEMGFRRGVYGCSKIFLVLPLKRKNGCLEHVCQINEVKYVF